MPLPVFTAVGDDAPEDPVGVTKVEWDAGPEEEEEDMPAGEEVGVADDADLEAEVTGGVGLGMLDAFL